MTQLAHNLTQEPRLEQLKTERRSKKAPGEPELWGAESTDDKANFHRLLGELQSRFSDSVDVAYLIESEVNQRTADLYRKANYDSLTHLPNRGYFHDILDKLVQGATEKDTIFSLLFLDLDGFKQVNDTLGHHIGDELLRYVSGRLVSSVRDGDIVSRLGGDEFVILLSDVSSREDIEVICNRIVTEISRPYWFDGVEVLTSTSIGVSQFPQDSKLSSELIEQADEALYVAKSKGKKTFRFYDDVKFEVPVKSHELQQAFEDAIQASQFQTYVEPQIDLKQSRIVGGYISLEWVKADGSRQPFEDWQVLLKNSGYEETLGLWLLDTACFYLRQWSQCDAELVVTVPVLDALWQKDDFLTLLLQRLVQYGITANQLQLAFAMDKFDQFDGQLVEKLKELSEAGFQMTLTGLGATPLNLPVLSGLNVQEFKFDQAWLKTQMASAAGRKWIQALIQMGQGLDACMIATGLDEESEAVALKQWGCSLGQGPYWTQPIDAQSFEQLLT